MLWIISLTQSTNYFCSRDYVVFEFRVGEAIVNSIYKNSKGHEPCGNELDVELDELTQ